MEKTEPGQDKKEIKTEFEKLGRSYNLPKFEKLAEDFDIEKIEKETSFLLRDIRHTINEKISAYLHLFEMLTNPTSPQMFIFNMLKNSGEDDKKMIKEIYTELSKLQIDTMKLDTIYDEKKEAEFIQQVFDRWQELKIKIYSLLENFDKKFEKNNNSDKKGYFG